MAGNANTDDAENADNLANLSINEIIFRNWRERLVVHPLLWSARQLHLLRCTFLEVPTVLWSSHIDPCNATESLPVDAGQALSWKIITDAEGRDSALESLLACYSFTKLPEPLVFRFGTLHIRLPVDTYVSCTPKVGKTSQSRSISFVEYLDVIDRFRYRWPRPRHWRIPELPENETHLDPYHAAVLIAQAQRCQQQDTSSNPEDYALKAEASYKVHVIFSNLQEREQVYVHTADVTNAFLDKIAHHSKKPGPADVTSLNIWHTAVQFEPHETFHRRLMAVIHHSPEGLKRRRPKE